MSSETGLRLKHVFRKLSWDTPASVLAAAVGKRSIGWKGRQRRFESCVLTCLAWDSRDAEVSAATDMIEWANQTRAAHEENSLIS